MTSNVAQISIVAWSGVEALTSIVVQRSINAGGKVAVHKRLAAKSNLSLRKTSKPRQAMSGAQVSHFIPLLLF